MPKLVLVAALLVIGATPDMALAASFDCAKAGTGFENAICGDTALSQKDEALAKTYSAARKGLSEQARAEVLHGQRNWLDFAQRACTPEGEPISSYDNDQRACLADLFDQRIETLQQNRTVDGLRYYTSDSYEVHYAQSEYTEPRVMTGVQSVIQMDGDTDLADAFNKLAMAEVPTGEGTDAPSGDEAEDTASAYETTVTLDTSTPMLLTLKDDFYSYSLGAAHGLYGTTYAHLLRNEKRPLVAADIFEGDGWQQALTDLALAYVKDHTLEDGEDFPWDVSDMTQYLSDPSRWSFETDGLHVQFELYEVVPYAAGMPEAIIPWDDLKSYLTPDALKIANVASNP